MRVERNWRAQRDKETRSGRIAAIAPRAPVPVAGRVSFTRPNETSILQLSSWAAGTCRLVLVIQGGVLATEMTPTALFSRDQGLIGQLVSMLPLLLVAGCASYGPRPLNPSATLSARSERTLDAALLDRTVRTIAPRAEPSDVKLDRLSLFAAILLFDPKVEAARAAVETAKAQARADRKAPGPVLTLTSEYANDPATRSPWLLGGVIDVPIDAGGRRAARLTASESAVLVARYSFAETLWAERMAVRRALIDRMIAQRQAELASAVTVLRNRQVAVLERKVAAGDMARSELVQAKLAQAAAQRLGSDAAARRIEADRSISGLLGFSETALAKLELSWDGFETPPSDPLATIGHDDRMQAITARSNVLKALASYDQAEANLRGEVARQFPAIVVSPGYTWERGLVKLPLSIGLSLPPLDLNRAGIAAATARRLEAGKQVEAEIAAGAALLDATILERRQASDMLERIRKADLPGARQLAAQSDAALRLGSIDTSEWAIAQIGMLQFQLSELDALARVLAADAALEDALQRPLEGPELMIDNMRAGVTP